MRASILALAAVLAAMAADGRVLPRALVLTQTQFYPLRERSRGYLCRYVDNPLCVDPDVPTNRVAGSFLTNEEFERTQREALEYGLDGLAYFPGSERKAYEHGIVSTVSNALNVALIGFWHPSKFAEDERDFERALNDPRGYRFKGKTLVLSYWTEKFAPAARVAEVVSELRRKHGDTFMFVPDIPSVSAIQYKKAFLENGDLTEAQVAELKDRFRAYAEAADGLYIGETHMMSRNCNGGKTFDWKYYARIVSLVREVLGEPAFAGRKLLALSAICGHEDPATIGRNVMADGTRTLRRSFAVAAAADPDVIVMPEWDEYNENTCFAPTLYNSFAVKRIVRSLVADLHGRERTPLAGDDHAIPNIVLSWRKSLSPGEPFYVEILNVPDGTWSGTLTCRAEVLDDAGRLLKDFGDAKVDMGRMHGVHLEMETLGLEKRTRALCVRFSWKGMDGRRHEYCEGLNPVDFVSASSWNSRVVKQPLRDLASVGNADFSVSRGLAHAAVSCKDPIRYVQLCGNGQIQYVRGAPDSPCMRFRDDASNAVFQVSALKWKVAAHKESFLSLANADKAEWMRFPWGPVERGRKFKLCWMSMASEPIYLRIPASDVRSARLTCSFPGVLDGEVPLDRARQLGAYAFGGEAGAQIVVSRFDRQSFYPSALNRRNCEFTVPTAADRRSMVYWLQVVTMQGKTWRSKPVVVEKSVADRFPVLRYDFSPAAGNVVRPLSGEVRFFGMLGGPCSPASLFNRNGFASGGMAPGCEYFRTAVDGRPGRSRLPNGGWALEFDGMDDFVAFPSDTIPVCGDFKVSLDVRPDIETNRMTVLAAKFGSRGSLYRVDVERGMLHVGYSAIGEWGEWMVKRPLPVGAWSHVEVSKRGTELVAAVDGVKAGGACGRIGDSATMLYLGNSPNGVAPFKGGMANLEIAQ